MNIAEHTGSSGTMDKRFLFIGGDRRILYAAKAVSEQYPADTIGLGWDFREPSGRYEYIVLPLPVSRDGININAPMSKEPLPFDLITRYAASGAVVFCGGKNPVLDRICRDEKLRRADYFADEPLTLKNAQLTAEAAAAILSQSTDASLFGSEIVVTGWGRVARCTARLLKAFACRVTVCARKPEQRISAELEGFGTAGLERLHELSARADYIVNTVPFSLFSENDFAGMKKGAVYMELATLLAEPAKTLAEQNGVKYIHASGLPGKASPKTAGLIISEVILEAAKTRFCEVPDNTHTLR